MMSNIGIEVNFNGKKYSFVEELDDYLDLKIENKLQEKYIKQLEQKLAEKDRLDLTDQVQIQEFNSLYKKGGFDAVVERCKHALECGGVKEEKNGIVCMVTGGWSDDEWLIYNLNHFMSNFGRNHYCGSLRGGAFYYSRESVYDVMTEIVKVEK